MDHLYISISWWRLSLWNQITIKGSLWHKGGARFRIMFRIMRSSIALNHNISVIVWRTINVMIHDQGIAKGYIWGLIGTSLDSHHHILSLILRAMAGYSDIPVHAVPPTPPLRVPWHLRPQFLNSRPQLENGCLRLLARVSVTLSLPQLDLTTSPRQDKESPLGIFRVEVDSLSSSLVLTSTS